MSHYKIGLTGPTHLPQRITAAYRAAGKDAPADLDAVSTVLAAEPTARSLGVALATEAVTLPADQAQTWTEDAIARMTRALAADEVRKAVSGHRPHALTTTGRVLIDRAALDLADTFDTAAERLATLAAKLPTGTTALDTDAVMASDATKSYREVGQVLATLAALGALPDPGVGGSPIPATLRDVLRVVDIPEVSVAQVDRITGRALDHDETRERVRKFAEDVQKHGADVTLVQVARGTYGEGITLSWATSRTALTERVDRAVAALSAMRVDSWGHKAKTKTAPLPEAATEPEPASA